MRQFRIKPLLERLFLILMVATSVSVMLGGIAFWVWALFLSDIGSLGG